MSGSSVQSTSTRSATAIGVIPAQLVSSGVRRPLGSTAKATKVKSKSSVWLDTLIEPSTLRPFTLGFLLHSTTNGATTSKVNSFYWERAGFPLSVIVTTKWKVSTSVGAPVKLPSGDRSIPGGCVPAVTSI